MARIASNSTRLAIFTYCHISARKPLRSETMAMLPAFSLPVETERNSATDCASKYVPSARKAGMVNSPGNCARRYSANTSPRLLNRRAPRMFCSARKAPSISVAERWSSKVKDAAVFAPRVSARVVSSRTMPRRKSVRSWMPKPTQASTSAKVLAKSSSVRSSVCIEESLNTLVVPVTFGFQSPFWPAAATANSIAVWPFPPYPR